MNKSTKIAVIGLGYVGLPLYLLLKKKGFDVIGFDKDKNKIRNLNQNVSYITDVSCNDLSKIKKKNFYHTNDYGKNLSNVAIIVMCLPTPLNKDLSPDISIVKNSFNEFKKNLSTNTIVVLESTVYPGATDDIFGKFFNKKSIIGGGYAYSSERINPGQSTKKLKYNLGSITKVISANNNFTKKKLADIYKKVFKKIHICKTIKVAEMSKLLENSYRSVNIGLINEFKMICHKLDININEVIHAASTKPFGFTKFLPGPGVGGHCIPIDPIFVSWSAKRVNLNASLIKFARKVNLDVTRWTLKNILKVCRKKKFNKILILGLAYKENVNDVRESPALKIFEKLNTLKFDVNFFDPFVKEVIIKKNKKKSIKNLKNVKDYDCIIILTAHKNINYKKILYESRFIIDTRSKFSNYDKKNILFL